MVEEGEGWFLVTSIPVALIICKESNCEGRKDHRSALLPVPLGTSRSAWEARFVRKGAVPRTGARARGGAQVRAQR